MVVQAESGAVFAGDQPKAQAAFNAISATGRTAVAQLDRALGLLRRDGATRHPVPGLAELPSLVEQARSAGLQAELLVRGEPRPVSADLAAAAYRVVQEALTNVVRHARASRAQVTLDWQKTELTIDVIDDGRGPASRGAGGRGLVGMHERVRAFGGSLDTRAGDRGGFRVTARLPLPAILTEPTPGTAADG
jgi:signal transduction histidine kinase